jgi:hypothetical protein
MKKVINWQKIEITLEKWKIFNPKFSEYIEYWLSLWYKGVKFYDSKWQLVWIWKINNEIDKYLFMMTNFYISE